MTPKKGHQKMIKKKHLLELLAQGKKNNRYLGEKEQSTVYVQGA